MRNFTRIKIAGFFLISALSTAVFAGGTHGQEKNHEHEQETHSSKAGSPTDSAAVSRTVRVELLDTMRFRFDPALSLKHNDVVRFEITNRGKMRHEFSIGNEEEQAEHRAQMRNMPGMTHQDANTVTVEPGETRTLIWQFDGEYKVIFACNIPGHAEAGMIAMTELIH